MAFLQLLGSSEDKPQSRQRQNRVAKHSISSLTSVFIQTETRTPRNTKNTFHIYYTVPWTVELRTSYNGLKDFYLYLTLMQFNFLGQETQD